MVQAHEAAPHGIHSLEAEMNAGAQLLSVLFSQGLQLTESWSPHLWCVFPPRFNPV